MTTERPIIFNDAMVLAILDGRKTQTRRIMKPQPPPVGANGGALTGIRESSLGYGFDATYRLDNPTYLGTCPFGVVGDRLWVREGMLRRYHMGVWRYRAGDAIVLPDGKNAPDAGAWAFHTKRDYCPSIHMPRWASRLTLEITGIRVERVQDISEADAIAAGAVVSDELTGCAEDLNGSHRAAFALAWNSIHGRGAWDRNAWVWVLGVRKV